MKKSILLLIIFINVNLVSAQNLDLIVTSKGDSIACSIDSISNNFIYFTTLRNRQSTSTFLNKESVSEYNRNSINPGTIKRIPNTIYFASKPTYSFKKTSLESLPPYFFEAHKHKANRTLIWGSLLTLAGAGSYIYIASGQYGDGFGLYFYGAAALLVGIPITIVGMTRSIRVSSVEKNRGQSLHLILKPTFITNSITNQIAPGISFNITF